MSDPTEFVSGGFAAGQRLRSLLDESGPQPALTALAVGLLEGLHSGAGAAADILRTKLQHELAEVKLEREHEARQADYLRRFSDYSRESGSNREDA